MWEDDGGGDLVLLQFKNAGLPYRATRALLTTERRETRWRFVAAVRQCVVVVNSFQVASRKRREAIWCWLAVWLCH